MKSAKVLLFIACAFCMLLCLSFMALMCACSHEWNKAGAIIAAMSVLLGVVYKFMKGE